MRMRMRMRMRMIRRMRMSSRFEYYVVYTFYLLTVATLRRNLVFNCFS